MHIPLGMAIDMADMPPAENLSAHKVLRWGPENEGKWANQFRASPPPHGHFDFKRLDSMIAYYPDFKPRYHTLIWHKALPPTLTITPDNWEELITQRINEVLAHYPGFAPFTSVDVLNEILNGYASGAATGYMRNSGWYQANKDYWKTALRLAMQGVPRTRDGGPRLIINDGAWGECGPPENNQGFKFDTGVKLVREAKNAGLRVDGVGYQLHMNPTYKFDAALWASRCQTWMTLVNALEITEANVWVPPGMERTYAADYAAQIIKVAKDNANVPQATFWSTYNTWGSGAVMTLIERGERTELAVALEAYGI